MAAARTIRMEAHDGIDAIEKVFEFVRHVIELIAECEARKKVHDLLVVVPLEKTSDALDMTGMATTSSSCFPLVNSRPADLQHATQLLIASAQRQTFAAKQCADLGGKLSVETTNGFDFFFGENEFHEDRYFLLMQQC